MALGKTGIATEQGFTPLELGMAVTAEIKTGQRRVISYLLSPLLRYEAPDQAWEHAPVKVWRVADQKLVTAFPGPFTPVRQLSWSPDSRFLAAASGDDTARVFAPGAPTEQAGVATFDDPVSSAQFSPHGNELAVASGSAATIFELKH